jgi:hypothetical protein
MAYGISPKTANLDLTPYLEPIEIACRNQEGETKNLVNGLNLHCAFLLKENIG